MQEEKVRIRVRYTAKSLRIALENYFDYCKKVDEIPTKIGMLLFLKITTNTISEWKKKQKDTFLQQLNWANSQIEHLNLQRYLKANPHASAWYLERAFNQEYAFYLQSLISNIMVITQPL